MLALAYVGTALWATEGRLGLPLDDAYIHLQYARMIASGHPLRYHPADPPSTGATSLLYPFLLAAGYKLGASGRGLVAFALALNLALFVGAVALTAGWLRAMLSPSPDGPADPHHPRSLLAADQRTPWLGAALVALSGPLGWHFLSGSDAGLFTFALLLTLVAVWSRRHAGQIGPVALAAALLALARPEGGILAAILVVVLAAERWSLRKAGSPPDLAGLWPLLLPLACAAGQWLLNYLLTGQVAANGLRAKSLLYDPWLWPPDLVEHSARYLAAWMRGMLGGLEAGNWVATVPAGDAFRGAEAWLFFFPPLTLVWLLLGAVFGGEPGPPGRAPLRWLAPLWLLSGLLVSTVLETANWQWNRYQAPYFPIVIALALLGLRWLDQRLDLAGRGLRAAGLLWLGFGLLSVAAFAGLYARDVENIEHQSARLGEWVAANLPPDARIAVTDAGAIAYFGDRHDIDLVGLTTNGAAEAWRAGLGAVYERLAALPPAERPGYFAIYPRLYWPFTQTSLLDGEIYRRHLAQQAIAGEADIVLYRAEWSAADLAPQAREQRGDPSWPGATQVDALNVGDLADERRHDYHAWAATVGAREAVELAEHAYAADPKTRVLEGLRRVSGGERWRARTLPGRPLRLVLRTESAPAVRLHLRVDGVDAGIWEWGAGRGERRWIEVAALVPATLVRYDRTTLEIERIDDASGGAAYASARYWVFQPEREE